MKTSQKPAVKQNENSARYSITPDFSDAMQRLDDAIEKRHAIDAAIDKSADSIAAAKEAYEVAAGSLASSEANLALATTEPEYVKLEEVATAAAEEAEAKRRSLERVTRMTAALYVKAVEADDAIAAANTDYEFASIDFGQTIATELRAEINEVVRALKPVMLRAHAIRSTIRHPGIAQFLDTIVIADPDGPGMPFVDYRFLYLDDARIEYSDVWPKDADCAAVADSLKPILNMRMKFAKHRPFVHPDNRPKPYQIKGSSEGPGGRPSVPTAPPVEAPRMSIEEALSRPYQIKGSNATNHRTKELQELNMAAKLAGPD